MSDGTEAAVDTKAEPTTTSTEDVKTEQGGGKSEDTPKMVPYDRLAEVVKERNADRDELKTIKADQAKIREEKLKAEGKTAELLEDTKKLLEIATKDSDKLNAYESTRRETLLSELPEDTREIYKDVALDTLEKHVKAVREANPDNGGMASSAEASSSEDAAKPKSRVNESRQERAVSHNDTLAAYQKKYGGVNLDKLRLGQRG